MSTTLPQRQRQLGYFCCCYDVFVARVVITPTRARPRPDVSYSLGQVRDFKNQLTASRASSELLVDSNSRLSGEVSDVRQELREAKAIVEALQKDVKSYELLQQSQPSYMYAEMMAQTRLGLQDDNSRLQDEVYLLKARMESLPPTGSSYLSPSSSLVGRGNSSSPSAAPASAAASPSASPDSTRTVAASHGGGQELLPGSPPQAAY